jgi:hypothetical protein
MKEYKVGDRVWLAGYQQKYIEKPCPICFGKKEVMLILGDGSQVVLPCNYCGDKLFEKPSGVVNDYEYTEEPTPYVIDKMSVESFNNHTERHYYAGFLELDNKLVFDTFDEAFAKSVEIKKREELEHITQSEHIKKDKRKSFSWNAGYHLKEAKWHREKAEYHDKMARICKDRVKTIAKKEEK